MWFGVVDDGVGVGDLRVIIESLRDAYSYPPGSQFFNSQSQSQSQSQSPISSSPSLASLRTASCPVKDLLLTISSPQTSSILQTDFHSQSVSPLLKASPFVLSFVGRNNRHKRIVVSPALLFKNPSNQFQTTSTHRADEFVRHLALQFS